MRTGRPAELELELEGSGLSETETCTCSNSALPVVEINVAADEADDDAPVVEGAIPVAVAVVAVGVANDDDDDDDDVSTLTELGSTEATEGEAGAGVRDDGAYRLVNICDSSCCGCGCSPILDLYSFNSAAVPKSCASNSRTRRRSSYSIPFSVEAEEKKGVEAEEEAMAGEDDETRGAISTSPTC